MKYGELNQALLLYTKHDIHKDIPAAYYRRIMKMWLSVNNKNLCWDVQKAAAILLYLAFNEGVIQHGQLNNFGFMIMDWAEKLLEQAG